MTTTTSRKLAGALALAALLHGSTGLAGDVQLHADSLVVNRSATTDAISVSVTGPNAYHYSSPADANADYFHLGDLKIVADGLYSYEVTEYAYRGERIVDDPANGREGVTQKIVDVTVKSGNFRIKNGSIVLAAEQAEE